MVEEFEMSGIYGLVRCEMWPKVWQHENKWKRCKPIKLVRLFVKHSDIKRIHDVDGDLIFCTKVGVSLLAEVNGH